MTVRLRCERSIFAYDERDNVWCPKRGTEECSYREFESAEAAWQWLFAKATSLNGKGWEGDILYPEVYWANFYRPCGEGEKHALAFRWDDEAATEAYFERGRKTERYSPPSPSGAVEECDRCGGTGRYRWGAVENGKARNEATCFRCEGKGFQNDADRTRNYWYDMKAPCRAC